MYIREINILNILPSHNVFSLSAILYFITLKSV